MKDQEEISRLWTLLNLAKNGEAEAFAEIYKNYFTPVYRYIRLRVNNNADAEDLTQKVFLRLFQSRGEIRNQNQPPLAYLFAAARNAVIDFFRLNRHEVGREPAAAEQSDYFDPDAFDRQEKIAAVFQALEILSADQQTVISQRFINELSYAEIAALLGKNEPAVRQIASRALRLLSRHLSKDYE